MRQKKGSIGIAFFAALVLVLQSAFAVAAAPVQRDIFGNVICTEGGGGQMPARGGHDGGHLPDCCMLSPASTEWPAVVRVGETISYPSPRIVFSHDRRTPANPRAPPAAA